MGASSRSEGAEPVAAVWTRRNATGAWSNQSFAPFININTFYSGPSLYSSRGALHFSLTMTPSLPAMMQVVTMSRKSPWSTTPSNAEMALAAAYESLIGSSKYRSTM